MCSLVEDKNSSGMSWYPLKVKQEVIRGERRCSDVNISSRSWKPEAQIEIPNCIKGHCPSLPVSAPNPVSAMFHYLNYYHLTQRWTQPRTPPESQWWVRQRGRGWRRQGGRALKDTVIQYKESRMEEKRYEIGGQGGRTGDREIEGSYRETLSQGVDNKRRTNWECRDG